MVSTRQMSSGNGASTSSSSDQAVQGTSSDYGPAKFTRHSTSVVSAIAHHSCVHFDAAGQNTRHTSHIQTVFLLDMPQEILEKIYSFLPFRAVAQMRQVSRQMDRVCSSVLNSAFQRLQVQMLNRFQRIKSSMPRRESARRNHPLACESDIIETLHMRLTLLQMTFGKHIERRHICFFPGEILDEVHRILHYIRVTPKLARPYKVTDELFDLSTMAMEYFKEHIEPKLPEIATYFSLDFTSSSSNTAKSYLPIDSSPLSSEETEKEKEHISQKAAEEEPLPQSNMVLRKRIRRIKQGMKIYNSQLSLLRQELKTCKRKTAEQQKQITEQQKQLAEQQKQTLEYASRLDENDKKNEEISRKFSTLLQELNKCKTELQYWRSKSPATPSICSGCGNLITPMPQEDLQALLNQGVVPGGLELDLEASGQDLNLVPIPGTSTGSIEFLWDGDISSKLEESKSEQTQTPQVQSPNSNALKRKISEDKESTVSDTKKLRRAPKNRNKRSKV